MFHRMMNYGEPDARPGILLTKELIKKSLPKYKRHDDLIIIHENVWEEYKKSLPMPVVKCENSPFTLDEDELASLVCQSIPKPICRRLAIDKGVKSDGFRTPLISMLLGENGIVTHKDNRVIYKFDVTKCMFSFGNVNEKMRMASLDCSKETVVDLFAGIGYFSLPLLIHAQAEHLYACEWNPDAVEALRNNLALNKIHPDRITVIPGDNRLVRPTNVAQRVILGILPSSIDWMKTALECVDKTTGATLHCHDLIDTKSKQTNHIVCSNNHQPLCSSDTKFNSTESEQDSINSSQIIDKAARLSIDNQSSLYQSLSSSLTSSHSTLEKLSASSPCDDSRLLQSIESSEKDTNLQDRSSSCSTTQNASLISCTETTESTNQTNTATTAATCRHNSHDTISINSTSSLSHHQQQQQQQDCMTEPSLTENQLGPLEARGLALIERIKTELEEDNLMASLLHIQFVKTYGPHVNHVVFDIRLEPKCWRLSNGSIEHDQGVAQESNGK